MDGQTRHPNMETIFKLNIFKYIIMTIFFYSALKALVQTAMVRQEISTGTQQSFYEEIWKKKRKKNCFSISLQTLYTPFLFWRSPGEQVQHRPCHILNGRVGSSQTVLEYWTYKVMENKMKPTENEPQTERKALQTEDKFFQIYYSS